MIDPDEYTRRLTEASENLTPQRHAALTRTKEEATIRAIAERFWTDLERQGIDRRTLPEPVAWALETAIKEAMEV